MTKEGLFFPLPFIILAGIFYYLFRQHFSLTLLFIASVLFYTGLAIMLFFRDPERKVPKGDNLIFSPADGRIIRLEEGDCGPAISIFLSIFNVHVNRSPIKGTIKSVTFFPGKFHIASKPEAMSENQRNEIEIETVLGIVRMHQISGSIARRVIFKKKPGEQVEAGDRIGLIRFGSRVDLFLPNGSKIDIKLGQKVIAGETIIGKLP
jgi:phosphatidylserine decarboxylase